MYFWRVSGRCLYQVWKCVPAAWGQFPKVGNSLRAAALRQAQLPYVGKQRSERNEREITDSAAVLSLQGEGVKGFFSARKDRTMVAIPPTA